MGSRTLLVFLALGCRRARRDDAPQVVAPPQVTAPPEGVIPPEVSALALGGSALYALHRGGEVWRWAYQTRGGHDGIGAVTFRDLARVSGLPRMTALVAGDRYVCALAIDAQVWCWRDPEPFGERGASTAPAPVPALRGVQQLSAAGETVCALDGQGAVWCWGNTTFAPMGAPTQLTPRRLRWSEPAAQVSVGASHACLREPLGTVRCWGRGSWGELGDGQSLDRSEPVVVQGLPIADRVFAGAVHSCALARGQAYCWGAGISPRATRVEGIEGVGALTLTGYVLAGENSAGSEWLMANATTLAQTREGAVRVWSSHQRDIAEEGTRDPMTAVPGLGGVRALSAWSLGGAGVACALSGTIQCWSLGDSSVAMSIAPLRAFASDDAPEAAAPVAPAQPPSAPPPSGPTCTAEPTDAYHLRPEQSARRGGESVSDLSAVTVLERGSVRRRRTVLYRVRTSDGLEGWTFLLPERLDLGCPDAWRAP